MDQELLSGWYPGLGEIETIRRMDPAIREFLVDASYEDPDFVRDYLMPVFDGIDPEFQIVCDLTDAIGALEFEEVGLGNLGRSLKKAYKKVKKSVKKVAKSKAFQYAAAPFTAGQSIKSVREAEKKFMASKYGNIAIGVMGGVLAPFTGGASLAAAAALTAANTAYQTRKAAKAAKSAAKAEAGQLQRQAASQEAAAARQIDDFFAQNREWFARYGIDQAKWNSMTFDQKVATIDAAAKGQLQVVQQPVGGGDPRPDPGWTSPPGETQAGGSTYQPAGGGGGGGFAPTSGGGGGGGGFAPMETAGPKVAQAGMFGGPLPLIMAAGALVYILFGQKGHGRSRRTRRNPVRRSSRWIAAA